ncbi:MAG: hypothetical protein CK548_01075 [Opitutia bacterium]|nr:MAG: hypothetical protein CK548_01075 [Opitutae bacterium]
MGNPGYCTRTPSRAIVSSLPSLVGLNGEAEKLTRVVGDVFLLLGGRRQNDPLGHKGDGQSDSHRQIDRQPETAPPQIFANRSTQPTKFTPAPAPPRATTKTTPSRLPTSDGSIDSFFK